MDGMSFDKYIDNPSGGMVFTQRNMYKQMYKDKFGKVLVREAGRIEWKVFQSQDSNDAWYIYMKIPSEVIPEFYYDVVVKLYTTENPKKNDANLRQYAVGFYSNDPNFCYTFAHSFKKNKLFIPELSAKMPRQFLTQVASARNPRDNVWYVKSLYFAYLTMEKYNLFSRPMLKQNCTHYRKQDLLALITPADIKIAARQKAQSDMERQAREEKQAQRQATKRITDAFSTKKVQASPISKTTNITRKTKAVRSSKVTKITQKKT